MTCRRLAPLCLGSSFLLQSNTARSDRNSIAVVVGFAVGIEQCPEGVHAGRLFQPCHWHVRSIAVIESRTKLLAVRLNKDEMAQSLNISVNRNRRPEIRMSQ